MKIAWLINLYPPYVMGGNEIIARDIIVELRNREHQVYLLTGRGQSLPQDEYHLSPFNLDLDRMAESFGGGRRPSWGESWRRYFFDPDTYQTTRQMLQNLQPDLVVVDSFSLVSIAPLLAAVRSKATVLAQVNDKWLLHGLRVPGRGLWHCPLFYRLFIAMAQWVIQPVFRLITRDVPVIVNSFFMQGVYRGVGFKTKRLHVVHLGIDVEQFSPLINRAKLAQPVQLMFAGHLWEGKGPQVAIRALAKLQEQAPASSFVLDFYGKGKPEFIRYLKDLAAELGVENQVRFCSFASQDELAQAFYSHDIFLFTSIWDEPFSITLLQAMSSGIPVISTTVGGNPEAVKHKQTGLLVPPNDPIALARSIVELVQDPFLPRLLGTQASAAVQEKWSFSRYVDTLETFYRACIQNKIGERKIP